MSLSRNQLVGLLKVATAYDGRERGEADIYAWSDSAARAGWTYEEALEAVKEHFAFDGGFLTPAVVTKRITAQREARSRQQRVELYESRQAAIEGPARDVAPEPERIRSLVESVANSLGWQRIPKQKPEALSVECPHCHAAPGRPCARQLTRGHRRGEFVPLSTCHDSRIQASKRSAA
ncbi:zinc finger domain-containing protein [Saccharopolyspora taberi]|uniref:DNA-binding phage zinc finger domain-containing protein n=1 Tax=Saccharopolyspora taberi TaxID=60895 RepID=A0ABN3V1N7_9PSEU